MKIFGICAILYLMIICVVDVCDATCDDYVTVFEEIICPTYYKLTPLKLNQIEWNEVSYPCNLTDKNPKKKECVLEFNYIDTSASCFDRIKKTHHRSLIAGNNTRVFANSRIKTLDVLPKSNIIEKPNHTVNEEIETSMCDVKLFFINTNDMQKGSEKTNQKSKTQQHIIFCDYAETVCFNEGNLENYSSRDAKNVTNHTRDDELGEFDITIDRDETSTIQPIFTGYFNDSNYKNDGDVFKNFKTVNLQCKMLGNNNCKRNIGNKSIKQINVYIKTNYVQNNTITKYPNCTKHSSNNSHNVIKCEDILFAKHNKHILFTPQLNNKLKQELSTWNCQIIDLNNTLISSKQQNSEESKIYFKNCFNNANMSTNKNKSEDHNSTQISDNIIAKDDIKINKTEIASEKTELNNDDLTLTSPENRLTVLITEKANNCRQHYTSLSIHEGKIIDLGINNNKEKILVNNIVELKLSNCINVNSSVINNTEPYSGAELIIILKNESLNTSNLKLFNGTPKEGSVKQRIILRCDCPNRDINSNITSNKTELECESIDLNDFRSLENNTDQTSIANNTKEQKKENVNMVEENHNQININADANKNSNCSTNKTVESNKCTVNNKSNANITKLVKNKEIQNITSESKDKSKNLNFNRKKDIPDGADQNGLDLESAETEKIILIALLSIAGGSILMMIMLRAFPRKSEHNPTPTRHPPDDEETAF